MDLHRLTDGTVASAEERAAVDGVLGRPTSPWEGGGRGGAVGHVTHGGRSARAQRDLLLPVLRAVQAEIGWISPGALDYVSARLTVPPAEAFGVASFYALLSTTMRPPTVVHICDDVVCRTAGADAICDALESALGPSGTDWVRSPCLGQCDRPPGALVTRAGAGECSLAAVTAEQLTAARRGSGFEDITPFSPVTSVEGTPGGLLQRVGKVDPESLDDYRAHGGYAALRAAIVLGPEGVIRELKDARLLGRGGAAYPTGLKWEAVAHQPARPHYVVCNADESEPGTFKDRVLMEQDPFAVVEAMTIAGLATGSEHGYVYVRGEYPTAAARLSVAIDRARSRGLLGDDVMGSGLRFDIEVRRGAGAYICGEETALFNSIEGYRGEPRNKPPFPVERGLFGRPTVVNNVETLLNVPRIVVEGGRAYASIGTGPDGSTGTRLWCISGCVERPGLYEIEFGATLREVVEQAGGVRRAGEGRSLQAVLLGGAAGSFVGPDRLDLALTFEGARAAGLTLGSGVVIVFDDTVDLQQVVLRIARFFRDESCGQCVPCRIGTVRQEEVLRRLTARPEPGGVAPEDLLLLDDLAHVMREASICGLGQTATSAVLSAVRDFGLFR